MNVNAVDPHVIALDDADRVERAGDKKHIANAQIRASVKEHVVGTRGAAPSGWRRSAAGRAAKLRALAVDRSRPFDRHVLGIDRKDQADIAVAQTWNRRAAESRRRHGTVCRRRCPAAFLAPQMCSVTLLFSSTVPITKTPAGTSTVPPWSLLQASMAACNACVSRVLPSPFAAEIDDVVDARAKGAARASLRRSSKGSAASEVADIAVSQLRREAGSGMPHIMPQTLPIKVGFPGRRIACPQKQKERKPKPALLRWAALAPARTSSRRPLNPAAAG